MAELELCFITNRCNDCPLNGMGGDWAETATEVAGTVLESYGYDPGRIVRVRIPGVKRGVEEAFSRGVGEAERCFAREDAALIVWWAATGACERNAVEIARMNDKGEM